MTSTLAEGVGRSPGEPVRPLPCSPRAPPSSCCCSPAWPAAAIAYVLFPARASSPTSPRTSRGPDAWRSTAPAGFYANAGFSDYPPAYLYLLWPVGLAVGAPAGERRPSSSSCRRSCSTSWSATSSTGWSAAGPGRARAARRWRLAAAALYLFNPVSFYDSALWGQTDAAGALVLLLGVAALIRGNSEGAAALAATAALVKPQFGVVLIPLVAAVLVKRHLLRARLGPAAAALGARALAGWLAGTRARPGC